MYLLNHAPTRGLVGKTLYEAWHDRKPKVHHLRIFGCVAHVKTVKPHVKKLHDQSVRIVFVGYEQGSKAYCVYNPTTNKLHVTRDVIFNED